MFNILELVFAAVGTFLCILVEQVDLGGVLPPIDRLPKPLFVLKKFNAVEKSS